MIKEEKYMWNEIINENDLNNFMDIHYGFHDSCIKEFKYISGAYANGKIMHPVNELRTLKMIVQGKFKKSDVIEMEFIGLKRLNIFPTDENYTCEILDATMILKSDCIYWCDCGGLSEADMDSYIGTMICASKVRWRAADEYIGPKEVYVADK